MSSIPLKQPVLLHDVIPCNIVVTYIQAYAYEDASMGTVLSNIVASDSDSDSVIRYSVISGDKGGLFSMSDNGQFPPPSHTSYYPSLSIPIHFFIFLL